MSHTLSSRRRFLKQAAAGTAGVAFAAAMPAASYARILGANDRVHLGMIGVGRQSRGHLRGFVGALPESRVVALADVYAPNLEWAKANAPADAAAYGDFRRILDRPDVDAVVIGTPDHWHAAQTVLACQAGKDVYVEKPTSVAVAEGRRMVEAARRYGRMVQVGTQQRSDEHFQQAAEIVRTGRLGRVTTVRTWNYGNDYPDGYGNPPDSAPPPGLDWDLWLGPAPQRPFNINRFGVVTDAEGNYTRWATFRYFWDYAGGMMTDWGVHLLDIVHLAMGVDAPERVAAVGGKLCVNDNRETPDTLLATYQYPGFACIYENRACNGRPLDGHGYGIQFHGTAGTLFVDRSGFEVVPEQGSPLESMQVKSTGGSGDKHKRDWLESIRSRKLPLNDIEIGHRSTTAAILGNIAYRTGRSIRWDREREQILDDPEANRLVSYRYREPWTI